MLAVTLSLFGFNACNNDDNINNNNITETTIEIVPIKK